MTEIKKSMSVLKSSLGKQDSELNSSTATLYSRKEAYFCLECKKADTSYSYDKLLAMFDTYHKADERSNSKAVIEAYNWATWIAIVGGSLSFH